MWFNRYCRATQTQQPTTSCSPVYHRWVFAIMQGPSCVHLLLSICIRLSKNGIGKFKRDQKKKPSNRACLPRPFVHSTMSMGWKPRGWQAVACYKRTGRSPASGWNDHQRSQERSETRCEEQEQRNAACLSIAPNVWPRATITAQDLSDRSRTPFPVASRGHSLIIW